MLPWQPLRIEVVVGYLFDLLPGHFPPVTNIFDGCHGNIIIMLLWQPYKG